MVIYTDEMEIDGREKGWEWREKGLGDFCMHDSRERGYGEERETVEERGNS